MRSLGRTFLLIFSIFIVLAIANSSIAYTAPSYKNITMSLGGNYVAPNYKNITLSLGAVSVGVEDTLDVNWDGLPPGDQSFHNLTVDFQYRLNYTNASDVPTCEFYNSTDTLLSTNSTPPNNTITTFTKVVSGLEIFDSFYIRCGDSFTNDSTTTKTLTLDDTAPRMDGYSPLNGTVLELNDVIEVNISVSDNNLTRLEMNITDSSGTLRYHLLNTSISGPSAFEFNITVNTSGWATGIAVFEKIISDGNASITFNTLNNTTYINILDTIPPNITVSDYFVVNASANSTAWATATKNTVGLNNSFLIVNFTINEIGNCSISLNESNYTDMVNVDPNTKCSMNDSIYHTCSLSSIEVLSLGDNDVYVSCIDASMNEFENSSSGPLRINMQNIVLDFNITITPGLSLNFTPVNYTADNVTPTNQSSTVGIFTAKNNFSSNMDIYARLNETNINITLKIGNGSNYSLSTSINTSYQGIYSTLAPNATIYLWAWADYDNPNSSWYPKLQIKGAI